MSDAVFIRLTVIIEKEGDVYLAYCKELGTITCGDTIKEAKANLLDALEVYIEGLEEIGERDKVFGEKGVRIERESDYSADVDKPLSLSTFEHVGRSKQLNTYKLAVPV